MTLRDQTMLAPRISVARLTPILFSVTLFGSALLLFAVQPMFAKMVLPRLGGSPSVWSVAMVFFQAALLVGYAYAHLLVRTLSVTLGAFVHLGLLAAAAFTLPIGIADGFVAPPSDGVGLWVIALFAASIGLPFVVLSASAPLLQSWFAASGDPQARNPYVLYAASNLGSFAALLAYPFVIESTLTLRSQAWIWSVGFAVLALLVAAAAMRVARGSALQAAADTASADRPTWRDRLSWIALAAIPAGLVIAVTAYISTDVAAAPLLWVLPLALYLLTFVAVFRDRPWFRHDRVALVTPFLIIAFIIVRVVADHRLLLVTIGTNLLVLFVLAMLCHGEVYRRRPGSTRLTEFYLWTSLGGVIGGIFAGLLAPHLFNTTYEYPVLAVAALLALPGAFNRATPDFLRRMWPAFAVAILALAQHFLIDLRLGAEAVVPFYVVLILLCGWMLLQRRDAARFAALAAVAFIIIGKWQPGLNVIETVRSFFGVHQVVETVDRQHRILYHGTTIHGAERVRDADGARITGRPEPISYFYRGGPYSEAIEATRDAARGFKNVAVVGLGAGSLACHRRDGEAWMFFEIDPEVVRLARDPNMFRFLSSCAPAAPIVLGDARLTLAASPQTFDLIVLDAFTSDAIPTHLLTREAFRSYLNHLSPRGAIIAHISNRHMDLASVIAAVGASEGLVTFIKADENAKQFHIDYRAPARLTVLARSAADLGALPATVGWSKQEVDVKVPAWTDDYSDIIGAIMRKKFAAEAHTGG
jgi:hypothetical protein